MDFRACFADTLAQSCFAEAYGNDEILSNGIWMPREELISLGANILEEASKGWRLSHIER